MLGLIVVDSNSPGLALLVQLFECQPELLALLALLGFQHMGRVVKEQIHVSVLTGIDLLDALQGTKICLALAKSGVSDLGCKENLLRWQHAALLQRNPCLLFNFVPTAAWYQYGDIRLI